MLSQIIWTTHDNLSSCSAFFRGSFLSHLASQLPHIMTGDFLASIYQNYSKWAVFANY